MTPSSAKHTSVIIYSAIISRLLLLVLLVFFRSVISPYDTSASLSPPCLTSRSPPQPPPLFPSLASSIDRTIVWDGVYFVRIAECGYEYEQSYAFFPLLPICISFLSNTVFAWLVPLIGQRAVLGFSGYFLNNVSFVFAALYFYKLSVIVLKDPDASLRASTLFCFNPASIFYSSIYSESLYALLSVGGIYHLMSGANNISAVSFALSGWARSNGVLNAGYICFQTLHSGYDAIFLKKHIKLAIQVILIGLFRAVCIFGPFVAFQRFGYHNICVGRSPDEMQPWCAARIPLVYDYIQSRYWGVGFLRYFQVKQLPNFLLASPMLSLAVFTMTHYVKLQPKLYLSLGLKEFAEDRGHHFSLRADPRSNSDHCSENKTLRPERDNQVIRQRKVASRGNPEAIPGDSEIPSQSEHLPAVIIPFIFHLAVMAGTAFFVMHVQVAIRFLSVSPPLYWFASYLMASPGYKRWAAYLIWAYSAAYILLGSLLFSNFYPFT